MHHALFSDVVYPQPWFSTLILVCAIIFQISICTRHPFTISTPHPTQANKPLHPTNVLDCGHNSSGFISPRAISRVYIFHIWNWIISFHLEFGKSVNHIYLFTWLYRQTIELSNNSLPTGLGPRNTYMLPRRMAQATRQHKRKGHSLPYSWEPWINKNMNEESGARATYTIPLPDICANISMQGRECRGINVSYQSDITKLEHIQPQKTPLFRGIVLTPACRPHFRSVNRRYNGTVPSNVIYFLNLARQNMT